MRILFNIEVKHSIDFLEKLICYKKLKLDF